MEEAAVTFVTLPNEMHEHIASFLDTKSLCFFAATSKRSLRNSLDVLRKHYASLRTQVSIYAGDCYSLCHISRTLYGYGKIHGKNMSDHLGLTHTNNRSDQTQIETPPGALQQIVGGRAHIIALTNQGLYGCGINGHGRLGLGHTNQCTSWTRLDNLAGTSLQIAASGYHSIVLTNQGLYVCGKNNYGQLGLGHTNDCHSWTRADNLPGMPQQIVAGADHTFVLTDQGLYGCGYNAYGELGLGHNNPCNTFTPMKNLPLEIGRWFAVLRQFKHLIEVGGSSTSDLEYMELSTPAAKKMKMQ